MILKTNIWHLEELREISWWMIFQEQKRYFGWMIFTEWSDILKDECYLKRYFKRWMIFQEWRDISKDEG